MRRIVAIAILVLAASAILISSGNNISSAVQVEEMPAATLANPLTGDDIVVFILFGAICGTILALGLVELQILKNDGR